MFVSDKLQKKKDSLNSPNPHEFTCTYTSVSIAELLSEQINYYCSNLIEGAISLFQRLQKLYRLTLK